MIVPSLILGSLVSLAGVLLAVPVVQRLSHRIGWLDSPDGHRKKHVEPVPTAGGVAIVGAVALGLAFAVSIGGAASLVGLPAPLVLLGALLIASVGFWDDLHNLSHRAKFGAQLMVTALAFVGGARIDVFDAALGDGPLALVVSAGLTTIWVVGMMNAVNLIDGMDGLATGLVAIALAGLAFVYAAHGDLGGIVLVAAVTGALLGFLRFNFAPATIFMGDSGSLFLGYVLATYSLRGSSHADPVLALAIPAIAMGVPILDLGVSIVRRGLAGKPLFAADRDHIHHRLQAKMPTHRAALALYGLGTFFGLGAVWMSKLTESGAAAVFLAGTAVVYAFLAYVDYVPVPIRLRRFAERRRALRARQVEVARHIQARGGRVSSDRFEPAAGPER